MAAAFKKTDGHIGHQCVVLEHNVLNLSIRHVGFTSSKNTILDSSWQPMPIGAVKKPTVKKVKLNNRKVQYESQLLMDGQWRCHVMPSRWGSGVGGQGEAAWILGQWLGGRANIGHHDGRAWRGGAARDGTLGEPGSTIYTRFNGYFSVDFRARAAEAHRRLAMGAPGGAVRRVMVLWAYWNALIYLIIIMYFFYVLSQFSHPTVAAMMGEGDDPDDASDGGTAHAATQSPRKL
ncbi:hypothetical protein B0H16DRAFT_1460138 [Mycena metata]|uniref:Uncharacterized protein n=1 Tax=Mycena metata TaxID=1033252 RepID=A0AAD7IVS5_9AGAR|nr:hypothetical protein B0H16DRAFT_1460138 [Mycena metata]